MVDIKSKISSIKEIKKGPKGWYAMMSPEKGKKRGKNVSIGPDIMDKTVDDIKQLVESK